MFSDDNSKECLRVIMENCDQFIYCDLPTDEIKDKYREYVNVVHTDCVKCPDLRLQNAVPKSLLGPWPEFRNKEPQTIKFRRYSEMPAETVEQEETDK